MSCCARKGGAVDRLFLVAHRLIDCHRSCFPAYADSCFSGLPRPEILQDERGNRVAYLRQRIQTIRENRQADSIEVVVSTGRRRLPLLLLVYLNRDWRQGCKMDPAGIPDRLEHRFPSRIAVKSRFPEWLGLSHANARSVAHPMRARRRCSATG